MVWIELCIANTQFVCVCVSATEVVEAIECSSPLLICLYRLAGVSACQLSCQCCSSQERLLFHSSLTLCACYFSIFYSIFALLVPSALPPPLPSSTPVWHSSAVCLGSASGPYLSWTSCRKQSILLDTCSCVCLCVFVCVRVCVLIDRKKKYRW